MKPFHQLSDEEILALTNETLTDAIRLGALDRGIEIPITLSDALRASEWSGYQQPAACVRVYCPFSASYDEPKLGYLSQSEAEAALNGLVKIGSVYRKGTSVPCIDPEYVPQMRVVLIGDSPSHSKAAAIKAEDDSPSEEFTEYRDECIEKFGAVRQSDYDRKVRLEHRKEYLRLAGGNEEIAKLFYDKLGKGAWPNEDGSITHS